MSENIILRIQINVKKIKENLKLSSTYIENNSVISQEKFTNLVLPPQPTVSSLQFEQHGINVNNSIKDISYMQELYDMEKEHNTLPNPMVNYANINNFQTISDYKINNEGQFRNESGNSVTDSFGAFRNQPESLNQFRQIPELSEENALPMSLQSDTYFPININNNININNDIIANKKLHNNNHIHNNHIHNNAPILNKDKSRFPTDSNSITDTSDNFEVDNIGGFSGIKNRSKSSLLNTSVPIPYSSGINHSSILNNDDKYSENIISLDIDEYDKRTIDQKTNNVDLNKIMLQFKQCNSLMEWPTSTDVACYWCMHQFDTCPVFLPISRFYKQLSNKIKTIYIVQDNFCSYNCARTYNKEHSQQMASEYESMLFLLYKEIHSVNNSCTIKEIDIPFAPSRKMLSLFGGPMTIEQFRESSKYHSIDLELEYPPIYSLIPAVKLSTEIKKKKVDSSKRNYPTKEELSKQLPQKFSSRSTKTILHHIRRKNDNIQGDDTTKISE
jgi:hypothetical protein